MNIFRKLSVTLSVMLLACSTFAQKGVTGMVKDHNGAPLVGANIYVKGTTVSTITGPTGEFNINASDSNAVLLITYNGYQNMEVPVRDLATANMQMKLAASTEEFDSFYGNDRYYTLTTAKTFIKTDDVVRHFGQAVNVGFACAIVATFNSIVEQAVNRVAVVVKSAKVMKLPSVRTAFM